MQARKHFVVALTGGIAAGKSAVARCFRTRDVQVFDADVGAREVVARGSPGLDAITQHFGTDVLKEDGSLDRRTMRSRVFDDPEARKALEAIVHPAVRAWLDQRIRADQGPYCIVDIPLLAETWPQYAWVDRVLVVDAPDTVRIDRLIARDAIDSELASRMIEAQASSESRLELADDVINNSSSSEDQLDAGVERLHARYLRLASVKSGSARPR
ncbi:dephospho-CoA kinase [Oleiagrimonas sp.]|uniref:dephospho-CoA kinase n=1 Tax=Oleiagrimonas sp. TaxID=2010330 RepID=UPI00261795FF|nr:dephospho-CoA kinase [Oleiagrimonas sp.]MDA3914405.1 dephospho-CoA kinase [Oleiagrimonas sp.]